MFEVVIVLLVWDVIYFKSVTLCIQDSSQEDPYASPIENPSV